jgi:hypothetical protein
MNINGCSVTYVRNGNSNIQKRGQFMLMDMCSSLNYKNIYHTIISNYSKAMVK